MVGRAASVVSPFYFILIEYTRIQLKNITAVRLAGKAELLKNKLVCT